MSKDSKQRNSPRVGGKKRTTGGENVENPEVVQEELEARVKFMHSLSF